MSTAGRFSKISRLGEGTFGVVYKAKERGTGVVYALKRMNIPPEEDGVPATTIREIALLKELRHPNIVGLHDVLFQPPKLTLVFECCTCDLKKFQEMHGMHGEHGGLPLEIIRHFMTHLLKGLQYMHDRCVVHRDLKPQNLLITDNLSLKLADFGLSRVEGIAVKKYGHEAVTLWYRPPDVILGSANYGLAVDIWSVGCIFAEMATGVPLFKGQNDGEQLNRMFKLFGTPTAEDWPSLSKYPSTRQMVREVPALQNVRSTWADFVAQEGIRRLGDDGIDLLRNLLHWEPSKRLKAGEALQHRFLRDFTPLTEAEAAQLLPRRSSTTVGAGDETPEDVAGPSTQRSARSQSEDGGVRMPPPPQNPRAAVASAAAGMSA